MATIACKRILLALLFLTTVNLSNHIAGARTSAPQVIILNSYHPGFTWSDEEVSGIVEQLQQHDPDIVPASEYLDAKRFSGPQQLKRMKNYPADQYLQLMHFHIPLSALPAGSLVINRPRSFYDQQKSLVWGTISVVTTLTMAILVLSLNIRRRRQAEVALQKSEARKAAEQALREGEKLYRSLFENMLNGFAYCQMLYEQDQPQDFIYLDVNKSFETLTGLKDVVGKKVSEVIPGLRGSDPELLEAYGRVALTGTPEKFEIYVHSLKMWFAISVYSPAKEYFVTVFDVIAARKQAEEALRTAAHQWRTTFDAISDAVCLLDRDSRISQSNRAMADLVGKPHSEITGHFCWEFMDETEAIKSCTGLSMWRGRRRQTLTLPRGHRWLRVMVDPILDETGEITGAVQIVSDITTHKRSQDRIRDLNILLRAIQNINEALLRAKSESELFQQICDLLIGVPEVLFTWIGLVKPESFEVNPVAWAGDGEDYLSVIRVTWDDSENGQGPTGAAIRSGKPVVRKSIETDPQPNPWREEGLKRGHKSSIAVPLIHQDEVIGVLKVYAGREDAFKTKEIEFLTQVAGDIAVGVKSLRLEQGLEQSVRQLQDMMRQTVESISAISEIRDPYTAGHQRRTTQLACAIARELGLDDQHIEACRVTGFLHDIGKIGVPAEILSKPGKLSKYEMDIIQTHVQIGYDILKNIDFPWPVAQIVLQHHERINGSGYPAGLTGPETLLEAKILAVADVVEAMSSHRPYRPALGPLKAMEEISDNKGILYDPGVVEACVKLFEKRAVKFD